MNIATKIIGRKIESIFEHDEGERSHTPGRWPFYAHYIKTDNGIVASLGFCSLEEREQIPCDAKPISLGTGHRIVGIYEFSDPDHDIKDPLYDTVFVVTDRLEAISDNFTENGNGLVSMPWNGIVELDWQGNPDWDWEHNRMIDLSTGQIVEWDQMQRNIELANQALNASGRSSGS